MARTPISILNRYAHILLSLLVFASQAHAGIHIAGEKLEPVADLNEFPKQLRFFRGYGPPDVTMGSKPTAQRLEFMGKIDAIRAKGKLTADDQANLGGYLIYLKLTSPRQPAFEEAIAVLEAGIRTNPRHFALNANLGTAYQLAGKLDAAQRYLQTAVDLAPAPLREMEQLHLRLVQRRMRENLGRSVQPDLDLLFGRPNAPFRFVNDQGIWSYGDLAGGEVDKLPGHSIQEATRQIQQLLVWLPDDGRLHWQLAEWAMALKAPKLALDLYQESVDTFRLSHASLKQRRSAVLEAMHWNSLLVAFLNKRQPESWIAQTLGQGLALGLTPDALSQAMLQIASVVPAKKKLSDMFNDNAANENAPARPEKPFVIQPWHWALIVVGSVLAVFMLYWQISEWLGRNRNRKPA